MKKTILITCLIAAMSFNSQPLHAEASAEQNVGFFSGAIAGFSVAGPIGFVFGGAAGAILGNKVEKANQLEDIQQQASKLAQTNQALRNEIANLHQTEVTNSERVPNTPMLIQGLTLNLMFVTDSAQLSQQDEQMIARVSAVLKQYPELKIRLDGYADPRGEEAYNQTLSETRVVNVQQVFQRHGIDSARLIVLAHGESESTLDINDQVSMAMQRRVSVNFIPQVSEVVAQNQHY